MFVLGLSKIFARLLASFVPGRRDECVDNDLASQRRILCRNDAKGTRGDQFGNVPDVQKRVFS